MKARVFPPKASTVLCQTYAIQPVGAVTCPDARFATKQLTGWRVVRALSIPGCVSTGQILNLAELHCFSATKWASQDATSWPHKML